MYPCAQSGVSNVDLPPKTFAGTSTAVIAKLSAAVMCGLSSTPRDRMGEPATMECALCNTWKMIGILHRDKYVTPATNWIGSEAKTAFILSSSSLTGVDVRKALYTCDVTTILVDGVEEAVFTVEGAAVEVIWSVSAIVEISLLTLSAMGNFRVAGVCFSCATCWFISCRTGSVNEAD